MTRNRLIEIPERKVGVDMPDSISIIGGADGPTSVFIARKLGMNW